MTEITVKAMNDEQHNKIIDALKLVGVKMEDVKINGEELLYEDDKTN
jgi:hypothetical protein